MRYVLIALALVLAACQTTEFEACDYPDGLLTEDIKHMSHERLWEEYKALQCLEPRWKAQGRWPDQQEIYDAVAPAMLEAIAAKMGADVPQTPKVAFAPVDTVAAQYNFKAHEVVLPQNWRPHGVGMTMLAHEMVHAVQYSRDPGPMRQLYKDFVEGNRERMLETCVALEREAYLVSMKWETGPVPMESEADAEALAKAQCRILIK